MTDDTWQFGTLRPQTYRLFTFDPPWKMRMGTGNRPQHYPRMTDEEIAALRIRDLLHPQGAWVVMWITVPMTERFWLNIYPAYRKAGLRYSSGFTLWIKTHSVLARAGEPLFIHRSSYHTGQGLTTRKNAEEALLFKFRKPPPRLDKGIRELIVSPLREHSRKPEEFYENCEKFCDGPRGELFGRFQRPGWDVWCNEPEKFNAGALAAGADLGIASAK